MIGGLVSSTVLTLLVLPTLYNLVEGAKERRAEKRSAKADAGGAAAEDSGPSAPHALTRRELREHG